MAIDQKFCRFYRFFLWNYFYSTRSMTYKNLTHLYHKFLSLSYLIYHSSTISYSQKLFYHFEKIRTKFIRKLHLKQKNYKTKFQKFGKQRCEFWVMYFCMKSLIVYIWRFKTKKTPAKTPEAISFHKTFYTSKRAQAKNYKSSPNISHPSRQPSANQIIHPKK